MHKLVGIQLTFPIFNLFPQMGALAQAQSTKYLQKKDINMDQIECQALSKVSPWLLNVLFMNLPL